MILINRKTDFAIKALIEISKSEGFLSAKFLSKKLSIPKPFLRSILRILAVKGILNSTKGLNGGFSLAKKPEKIKIFEIIKIFSNGVQFNRCIFRKKICPDIKTCPLRKEIKKIEDSTIKKLNKITIKSLIEGKRKTI